MKTIKLFGLMIAAACTFQACQSPEGRAGGGDSATLSDSDKVDTTGGAVGMNSSPDMSGNTSTGNMDKNEHDITHQSNVDGDEADFMKKAAIGGMMEVEAGKLAQKSSNPKVKAFATQMVNDHTKANNELKALAEKKQILLPTAFPAEDKAHMDAMKKLNGAEFDKHYVAMMVTDHDKTIKLFNAGASSRDEEVKEFAKKTIPVITGHFEKAKAIQAEMK